MSSTAAIETIDLMPDAMAKVNTPEARAARRRIWLRAMAGELVATLIFFLCVMGTALNFQRLNEDPSAAVIANALASAFAAISVVYAFADVSGAHFNPAITLATWASGKTSNRKSISFIVVQLLGSTLSVLFLMVVFPSCATYSIPTNTTNTEPLCIESQAQWKIAETLVVQPPPDASLFRVFAMEFLLTFLFIIVIFMTVFENIEGPVQRLKGVSDSRGLTLYTTNPRSKTGFAPLAIGFAIGFLSFMGGSVSKGIFNPARLFGPALLSGVWHNHIWLYFLGEFSGAVAASFLSRLFVHLNMPGRKKGKGALAQPLLPVARDRLASHVQDERKDLYDYPDSAHDVKSPHDTD